MITSRSIDENENVDESNYWKWIEVYDDGEANINHTVLQYAGDTYIATNKNRLVLNNVDTVNCIGQISSSSGELEINNSKLPGEISTSGIQKLIVKNSEINGEIFSSSKEIRVLNNKINNGNIKYRTSVNSVIEIKNNEVIYGELEPVQLDLIKVSSDMLKEISGNKNIGSQKAGEINITTIYPSAAVYNLPKRVYRLCRIPNEVEVNIAAGSTIKVNKKERLSASGILNVNGTEEERVLITSIEDGGINKVNEDEYWEWLEVENTGVINLNYTDVKYAGDSYIATSKNKLKLNNVEIIDCKGQINSSSGELEINNSKILDGITVSDNDQVTIKNSKLKNRQYIHTCKNVNISNNEIDGNIYVVSGEKIEIVNNKINNGNISLSPRVNTILDISKNEINVDNYALDILLYHSRADMLKDIKDNVNINNEKYNAINISGNINDLNLYNNNT